MENAAMESGLITRTHAVGDPWQVVESRVVSEELCGFVHPLCYWESDPRIAYL